MPELDLTWIKANLDGCIKADCMVTMSPILVSDLVDEVERLRREKGQTYCAYCGATFEIDAPSGAQAVSEHIRTCEKHPLYDVMREVRRLEAELATAERTIAAMRAGYKRDDEIYAAVGRLYDAFNSPRNNYEAALEELLSAWNEMLG